MDRLQKKMNQLLQDELLQKIHSNTPAFFERMVVELMEKMGYGWGKVTQSSRDEGIDGLIYQDILKRTGASSATISRVNRCLQYGAEGYQTVLPRLDPLWEEKKKS